MKIVTGAAGFIGFHLVKNDRKKKYVIGVDNLNNYYSVKLKKNRIKFKNSKFKNILNLKIRYKKIKTTQ